MTPNGKYIEKAKAIDIVNFECGKWKGLAKTIAEKIQNTQSEAVIPTKIGYNDCANAMLSMWMDNIVTDGEYNRIIDKLNKHYGKVEES